MNEAKKRSDAQKRADEKYRITKIHRVPLDMKKRDFAALSAAVKNTDDPNLNAFIRAAINEKIDRDGLREIADQAAADFDKKQLSENRDDVV